MTYHDYYILQYDMLYAWIFFGCHDCHASFPDSTDCTTKSLQVTGPDGGGVGLVLRSGGIALPQPEETQGLSRRCHGAMVPWCHGAMVPWHGSMGGRRSLASSDSPHCSQAEITSRKASALVRSQSTHIGILRKMM